jgi:hypothetical protein
MGRSEAIMEAPANEPELGAVLESLPDEVVASLEVRDAWRKQVAANTEGLEFIVSDLASWPAGSTVRVAFLDGDTPLHGDIADATKQISDVSNLTLDFGLDPATGEYRRWTVADTVRAAEIRVCFDLGGYWSLVGTDSTDTSIGVQGGPIGGSPGQRSLNLGGYSTNRPLAWEGTVRHEFMHALAFRHEHQNMRGPCEADFRWDDDPGYVPTKSSNEVFVPDSAGRRPGIYTYLAGAPNNWPKAKVDHNLRTEDDPTAVASKFDAASVMLYRFAPFFYKSDPSSCAPTSNGQDLSDGDKRGLQLLYPAGPDAVAAMAEQSAQGLELIGANESNTDTGSVHVDRLIELMSERAVMQG